jgi:hypothetical protein
MWQSQLLSCIALYTNAHHFACVMNQHFFCTAGSSRHAIICPDGQGPLLLHGSLLLRLLIQPPLHQLVGQHRIILLDPAGAMQGAWNAACHTVISSKFSSMWQNPTLSRRSGALAATCCLDLLVCVTVQSGWHDVVDVSA